MKKIFLHLLICLTVLTSCSSDEEKSFEKKLMLPKRLIINPKTATADTITLLYNENKILSIANKFKKYIYRYDGNKIISQTKFRLSKGNEEKISESSFYYINEDLHSVSKIENNIVTEYVYTFNIDGTIKKEVYDFDSVSGKMVESDSNDILTFSNGNLTESVYDWGKNYDVITSSRFEYDAKNNAFKNILGFDKLLSDLGFCYELNVFSINNITRHVNSPIKTGTIVFEPYMLTMKYEYNKNGYPTKRITYDYKGEKLEELEYRY